MRAVSPVLEGRKRQQQHQEQVDDDHRATRDEQQHERDDAQERDVETEVAAQPLAHAADHGAFTDLMKWARLAGRFVVGHARHLHRPDLIERRLQFTERDYGLARLHAHDALICDRLLKVGHDLRLVGISFERFRRLGEIVFQASIGGLVELERAAIEASGDGNALHGSKSDFGNGTVDAGPVVVECGKLGFAAFGQPVVLAGRAGFRFLPLVLNEFLAAQFAEQWVKSAFLGSEFGARQAPQDVGDVCAPSAHDFEDKEFQEAFADRGEF